MDSELSFVSVEKPISPVCLEEDDDDDGVKVDAKIDTALEQGKATAKKPDEKVEAPDSEGKKPKDVEADEEEEEDGGVTMLTNMSLVQILINRKCSRTCSNAICCTRRAFCCLRRCVRRNCACLVAFHCVALWQ